ncbi:MAG: tyrosine-protein phosphatase [Capsulimonas sp.]|uniref:fused DSP-PTPase phosphatase/NAD kinase-like protein n=1 Tax=Capsulimonas sp. TaxID=2494211 RepID=UPI003262F993
MKYTRRAAFSRAFGMLSLAACLGAVTLSRAFGAQALPNFHEVAPGITRGAAPTMAGLQKLKAMGVHTIIDLRYSPVKKEQAEAKRLGFTWINLPMGAEAPTQKQVATFLATLKKSPDEPVFVHCQHGADRTGCMIGIWRVTQQGWAFPQTWAEMRKYGFNPRWRELTGAVKKRVLE